MASGLISYHLSVHIIIVVLCVSIYVRMSVIRAEMTPFRFARDMRTERRAGVTIIVLLLTLSDLGLPTLSFCAPLLTLYEFLTRKF